MSTEYTLTPDEPFIPTVFTVGADEIRQTASTQGVYTYGSQVIKEFDVESSIEYALKNNPTFTGNITNGELNQQRQHSGDNIVLQECSGEQSC